ncbi:MAG: phytanoyl-CoA dioxygenase family protein [Planctomycetes bacterium]|nr:phytanoyl-CoA dioxygenase family protein [Planctomycetota bacterium]
MAEKSSFEIIPDRDEFADFKRDLRFHAATTANPQVLTKDDLERFNRNGYLAGIRIFNVDEIDEQRRYFDELLHRVMAAGGDSYSISTAHLTYGKVYDLLTHPRIVSRVKDLLGENVIGWGSHYFCKLPGDGAAVTWHQDASYWPMTPSKTVTVWLAVDDADPENACMRFIPGSHQHGHIPFRVSRDNEGNVLDQTVDDPLQYGEAPIDVELNAGEISMHSDLLLHGSQANASHRRRCGLTLRYCTPDVHAHLDWNQKGVIVAGRDPTGHWANPQRPISD